MIMMTNKRFVFDGVQFIKAGDIPFVPISDRELMNKYMFYKNEPFSWDGPSFPMKHVGKPETDHRLEEIALGTIAELLSELNKGADEPMTDRVFFPLAKGVDSPIALANAYTKSYSHNYSDVAVHIRNDLFPGQRVSISPGEIRMIFQHVRMTPLLQLGLETGLSNAELVKSGVDIYQFQ